MYERLADTLGTYEAASSALQALREPSPEVLSAGISAEQWLAAIDAMLASADAVDAEYASEAAKARREQWPGMCRELEAEGCRLWHPSDDGDIWRIEGPGVAIQIDLATGEIDDTGLHYKDDPFAELVKYVRARLAQRREDEKQAARKEELRRRGYTWNGKLKGWVPPGGGPIIPGGGSAI